ncbi:carbohydrate-binding protein [Pontiellaceae bacterium B1224]|nr:carbohydrate-binding protein [Pontiellaceae bacterium B1224]
MKFVRIWKTVTALACSACCWTVYAADISYIGVTGGEWATGSNWSSGTYPASGDIAFLDTTVNLSVESPNNFQGIRVGTAGDGRLQIGSRGMLTANTSSGVTSIIGDGSGNTGSVQQEGGIVEFNRLAIGSNSGSGSYHIHSGTLTITRESGGHSLFLAQNGSGDGTFRISSGSFITRGGVQLGSVEGGIGRFEVIGSHPRSIGIGATGSVDGRWTQYADSMLSVRIDKTSQGVTPIFIDDYNDDGGGDVVFENGALLDVDFTAAFLNGGTFTVMEWEGDVTNNGLQFAPSVDTNVWSFSVDAVNKRLTVTAVGSPASRAFVHPGLSHKLSDLDRMRDMVAAGIEPYASSFAAFASNGKSQHTYQPSSAAADLPTNNWTPNNNALRNDGVAAYYNALMWYITGDSRHAEASIRIFTAWSPVQNIDGIPLNAGRHWRLIEAAEIIKSTYDGWDPADMQAFKDMLVYPGYSNTTEPSGNRSIYWRAFQGDPGRHGNQGLFAMRCVMAIGVFLDNEIIYDRALRYLQGAPARSDDIPYVTGPSIADTQIGTYEHFLEYSRTGQESTIADYGYNEVIHNYIYPNGQGQEFSRDMAHGLAGIGIIATMSEMAWSQGDDLYGYLDNRPLLGLEYFYRYNLSWTDSFPDQTTPWEPTVENGEFIQRLDQSGRWFSLKANPYLAQNTDPEDWKRGLYNDDPMYEMNLAHYRDRIGVSSNDTKWLERGLDLLIAEDGFEGEGTPWDHPSWGGLTFRRVSPGDPIRGFVGDTPDFAMNELPMTIEAENYDYFALDGEGRTYHDLSAGNSGGEYRLADAVDIATCSEGGYALTDLENGEWFSYTISVPEKGKYSFDVRYAADAEGGIRLAVAGSDITGNVILPATGGSSDWATARVTQGILLDEGVQSLRVHVSGASGAYHLNSLTVNLDELISDVTEHIEAETRNAQSGTQLETCTDTGGGQNVAYISDGDWCRYDNLMPGTNTTFRARVARPDNKSDSTIEVRLGSPTGTLVGSVDVPLTGGWQNWTSVEASLDPVAGSHNIYLVFVESGTSGDSLFNINWFELVNPDSQDVPDVPAGLDAAPANASQIELTWDGLADASGYHLKRATVSGGPYEVLAFGPFTTSYLDTGLLDGSNYYYVVSSLNNLTESSDSAEVSAVPSAPINPADVVIGPVAISSGDFNLTITHSVLGHNYRILATEDLVGPDWQVVSATHAGTGGMLAIDLPILGSETNVFYKLETWRQ